jgi:hypothetical protein
MHRQRMALGGLVLLLAAGIGVAVWWIVLDSGPTHKSWVNVPDDPPSGISLDVPGNGQERPTDSLPAPATSVTDDSRESTEVASRRAPDAAGERPSVDAESRPVQDGDKPAQAEDETSEALREAAARMREITEQIRQATGEEFKFTIAGRVIDNFGQGVADAKVLVSHRPVAGADAEAPFGMSGVMRPALRPSATTGTDGSFEAEVSFNVPVNTASVDLSISADARGFASEGNVTLNGVQAGSVHSGIELTLQQGGRIEGRVLGPDLKPIPGVHVTLIPALPDVVKVGDSSAPMTLVRASSDREGNFRFEGVRPGNWKLTVTASGSFESYNRDGITAVAGQDTRVDDIVLTAATSLRLRVLRDDGNPIGHGLDNPRVRVTVRFEFADGSAQSLTTSTVASGDVVFTRVPTTAGNYTVSVPGFQAGGPFSAAFIEGRQNNGGEVRLNRAD